MAHSHCLSRPRQPFQSPRQKYKSKPRGERFRPLLEALEDRTLLSATTYLVNVVGDTGTGSGTAGDLRYCINQADNPANAGSTITFDTTALGSNTITLTKGQLAITDNMTITGPGASNLTLSGNNASRIFNITATTAHVTISGLTVSGGSAAYGGGIYSRGSLTVSDSTLSGNSAGISGGGICNDGTLTVSNSTLTDNSAPGCGGGAISNSGSLTLSGSTVSDNTGYRGSGVLNSGAGTLTVKGSTLSGNTATYAGGLWSNGTVTVSGSTLSGNSATSGGAIYNIGNLTVNNSTLAGNSAQYVGGLHNTGGTATLTNVTISDNVASVSVAGIDAFAGTVLLHNTLVAGNVLTNSSVDKPFDVAYNLDSGSDYNLIGDGSGGLSTANHNLLGSIVKPLDPLLSKLGSYDGPTQTLALLPGSPAIDAGSSTYGGSTDQRGKSRVNVPDIGAFESQGFTLAASSGNNQSTDTDTAFTNPLVVSITANNSVEPVAGGVITFTAPSSSASAVLTGSPATIGSDGRASVTAAANIFPGTYTVSTSATGVTPASFSLTNIPGPTLVTTLLDVNNPSGTTSLRQAINNADTQSDPQPITFDPNILTKQSGNVIDLQSALPDVIGNVTIEGPGANVLTVQRDSKDAAFSVFTVDKGAKVTISGLTISGGSTTANGGGIDNLGSLTVSDSTLSGNSAANAGGGIANSGTLTVNDSILSGNSANGAGGGGGLWNDIGASLLVSDCTFQANNAAYAGGLANNSAETAIVQSSTFEDNIATHDGGGLYNGGTGAELQVTDCTIADNHVVWGGGGIYVYLGQMLTVTNTTITGNTADYRGGIYFDRGNVTLQNSIVAGNTGYDLLGSSLGGSSSASFSLIQNDGTGLTNGNDGNIVGINPLLAPLGNYGGTTQTMALLPGSPAIDAGSSAYGGSTDQRGKPRVGPTDIGAFESQGFTIAVSTGNNQSTEINTSFADPLEVTVTAKNAGEPVAGGTLAFTAPTSGASAVLKGSTMDFSNGFANAGNLLTLNGSTKINGNALELTDGSSYEADSAFSTKPVNVAHFNTQFSFQLTAGPASADGFTFCIQGVGNAAVGSTGGGLGYGPDPTFGGAGIAKSVAVKFDLYNNMGEGPDSTGLYTDGAVPTIPAIDLSKTGIDLHSGHVFDVGMTYDGSTLTVKETDTSTQATATQSYAIDIPSTVGSGTAYVGFTGGTGGAGAAIQDILTWTYSANSTNSSPATIGSDGKASVTATANGTTGTFSVSAAATGIASPAKFSLTNTAAASPAIMPPTPAATTMAAAPSPQETSDRLMSELGQNWDLLLTGDKVHVLKNKPQALTGF